MAFKIRNWRGINKSVNSGELFANASTAAAATPLPAAPRSAPPPAIATIPIVMP